MEEEPSPTSPWAPHAEPASSRPPARPEEAPFEIPHHELLHRIGQGGAGTVWSARQRLTGHLRAVKLHHMPSGRERLGVAELKRRGVEHPNLLPVEDVVQVGEWLAVLMPLADAAGGAGSSVEQGTYVPRSLSHVRDGSGGEAPSAREVAIIAAEVGMALQCLHGLGAVHCDVKPANVLRWNGRWCLADYGMVTDVRGSGGRTGFTPGYCPPEGPGTPAADQYSLGVMVVELLCGRRPEPGRSPAALLESLRGRVPAALHDALSRALRDAPQERWPSVAEFSQALRASVADATGAEDARPRRRRVGAVAAVGFLAVLMVIAWRVVKEGAAGGEPEPPAALTQLRAARYAADGAALGDPMLTGESCVEGQHVGLEAAFDRPVAAFVVALNTDGSITLVWPRSESEAPAPAAAAPGRSGLAVALTDGPGLQGLLVLAGPAAEQPFQRWKAANHLAGWPAAARAARGGGDPGQWRVDDGSWRLLPAVRGDVREMVAGPPPDATALVAGIRHGGGFSVVTGAFLRVRPAAPPSQAGAAAAPASAAQR